MIKVLDSLILVSEDLIENPSAALLVPKYRERSGSPYVTLSGDRTSRIPVPWTCWLRAARPRRCPRVKMESGHINCTTRTTSGISHPIPAASVATNARTWPASFLSSTDTSVFLRSVRKSSTKVHAPLQVAGSGNVTVFLAERGSNTGASLSNCSYSLLNHLKASSRWSRDAFLKCKRLLISQHNCAEPMGYDVEPVIDGT